MRKEFIIGIDLGGTNLKVALLDLKYRIRKKEILNTRKFTSKSSLISGITFAIKRIIQSNNLKRSNVLGVGLGLPGPVDPKRGIVQYLPNIPGWHNVNLKRILQKELGLRVFLDNDANLMCRAEFRLGAARGLRNAVCLTLGTGVGGGIIVDKALFRGSTFNAGEVGHIPINESGPKCNCGGKACLEAYVGNNAILRQARQFFGKSITLEKLSALAAKGNKQALKIWREVGTNLGIALAGIVNLLNPDAIVLGGGVAEAGELLFAQVRKTILQRAMPAQAEHVRLVKARLERDAGLIGAAILVKEGF
ncbi:MAG: ROK family protein [Candidatus Omnitrophota bacterium]